jgi:hypothetical protein
MRKNQVGKSYPMGVRETEEAFRNLGKDKVGESYPMSEREVQEAFGQMKKLGVLKE